MARRAAVVLPCDEFWQSQIAFIHRLAHISPPLAAEASALVAWRERLISATSPQGWYALTPATRDHLQSLIFASLGQRPPRWPRPAKAQLRIVRKTITAA